MTVGYRQRKDGLAPDYICAGPREIDRIERGYCQRISGYSLDLAVGAMLVETVTPLALEVALSVQQEMQSRWDEADRLRRLQVDRARYESELARRRFLRVDPDNRLVAASLVKNQIVTAVGRELLGFIWAIGVGAEKQYKLASAA
jgi:hypothetical protein